MTSPTQESDDNMSATIALHGLDGRDRELTPRRLLIAGFTGRDPDAVEAHVDELRRLGVPAPESTPTLLELETGLLTTADRITVEGDFTSGEVEPVIAVVGDERLLLAGSDHTDRTLETAGIALSKRVCAKVVSRDCVPLAQVGDWDAVALESWADDEPYQRGSAAQMLDLPDLLAFLERSGVEFRDGDVIFLGTVPVLGELRAADRFRGRLTLPAQSGALEFAYGVERLPGGNERKPELEFYPAERVPWTACRPGVPGLTERILSADPAAGVATRMLRLDPGVDTTPLGVQRHDFWEEVYVLEGELHDLTLDEVFPAGTYACRPPGMPHGPWRSTPGCVTFEVRYPAS